MTIDPKDPNLFAKLLLIQARDLADARLRYSPKVFDYIEEKVLFANSLINWDESAYTKVLRGCTIDHLGQEYKVR